MKRTYTTFSEDAYEVLDFMRCQRADGTFYGTSGQCRKGKAVGPKEMKALKTAAASGNKKAKAALDVVEGKKTKEQAVKELGGEKAAPAPKSKKRKVKPDLQTQYAGLAKQAQEAMAKGDMDKALRLNQEAMTVMSKIKSQEEKGSPEVKKREEKVEKVLEGLKKAGSSNVTKDSEGAYITDKVGSNEVKTLITPKTDGSYEIGYKVNDSYTKGGVTDRREQVRVALTAKRQFDSALSAFPDGTKIRAFAYDDDGGGDTRRKAYEKLGFKHQGNNVMTGVVSGGKIEGTDFAEKMASEEKLWLQIIFANEAGKNSQRGA